VAKLVFLDSGPLGLASKQAGKAELPERFIVVDGAFSPADAGPA
jgi:hypothetical protein